MKKNKEEKKDRIPFKVLWKNPFYNSLIKMGMWVVFFLIIYLCLFISYKGNDNNPGKSSSPSETEKALSYAQMKKDLVEKELNIKYILDDYYITGIVKDNVLTGTLEDNKDNTIKIKYDGEKVYQVKKEEEKVKDDLLKDITKEYLLPKKIVELVDDPKIIGVKSTDGTSYTYNLDKVNITFYLNTKAVEKIIILEGNKTYELEYEVIDES